MVATGLLATANMTMFCGFQNCVVMAGSENCFTYHMGQQMSDASDRSFTAHGVCEA